MSEESTASIGDLRRRLEPLASLGDQTVAYLGPDATLSVVDVEVAKVFLRRVDAASIAVAIAYVEAVKFVRDEVHGPSYVTAAHDASEAIESACVAGRDLLPTLGAAFARELSKVEAI